VFNCLGYIKKYAASGNRTNVVSFLMLLLARIQLPGLPKEICREGDSNQCSLFPKATAGICSTAWAMPADSKNEGFN
jgi:hypothetical protein